MNSQISRTFMFSPTFNISTQSSCSAGRHVLFHCFKLMPRQKMNKEKKGQQNEFLIDSFKIICRNYLYEYEPSANIPEWVPMFKLLKFSSSPPRQNSVTLRSKGWCCLSYVNYSRHGDVNLFLTAIAFPAATRPGSHIPPGLAGDLICVLPEICLDFPNDQKLPFPHHSHAPHRPVKPCDLHNGLPGIVLHQ